MTKIAIFGAGFAGLLAANVLKRHEVKVFEAQPALPDNHGAILRFRSDKVGIACHVPFSRQVVEKGVFYHGKFSTGSDIRMSNIYSQRVSKVINTRSIKATETVERWISPPDFLECIAKGVPIQYNQALTKEYAKELTDDGWNIISTIPMPIMCKIMGIKDTPDLSCEPIMAFRADVKGVKSSANQTIYFPSAEDSCFYRMTLQNNVVIGEAVSAELREGRDFEDPQDFEWLEESYAWAATRSLRSAFGLSDDIKLENCFLKEQKMGKMSDIDTGWRKKFQRDLTATHNIYSLGRFATWRQGLLLDDVLDDIKFIDKMIASEAYDAKKEQVNAES